MAWSVGNGIVPRSWSPRPEWMSGGAESGMDTGTRLVGCVTSWLTPRCFLFNYSTSSSTKLESTPRVRRDSRSSVSTPGSWLFITEISH